MSQKESICCPHCMVSFSAKKSLYRHNRKFHRIPTPDPATKKIICSLCEGSFKTITDLHMHIHARHFDINLKFQKITLYCMEDFQQWKLKMESESKALFVKNRGDIELADGRVSMSYFCHRSGVYKPKGHQKRRLKKIGSLKIGSTCPAYIVVHKQVVEEAIEIIVHYQSVHIGHECIIYENGRKKRKKKRPEETSLTMSEIEDYFDEQYVSSDEFEEPTGTLNLAERKTELSMNFDDIIMSCKTEQEIDILEQLLDMVRIRLPFISNCPNPMQPISVDTPVQPENMNIQTQYCLVPFKLVKCQQPVN